MRHYGLLLEHFQSNSQLTNNALFTMMHHVAGDLGGLETLFCPQILAQFSDMRKQVICISLVLVIDRDDINDIFTYLTISISTWQIDNDNILNEQSMMQDMVNSVPEWADLIEYVIQKFITSMGTHPRACASNLLERLQDCNLSENNNENGFTKYQLGSLERYYNQCHNAKDVVGGIIALYKENFNATKSRLSVIQSLLSRDTITFAQYMSLMYMKPVLAVCKRDQADKEVVAEAGSSLHDDLDWHDTVVMNEMADGETGRTEKIDQIEALKGKKMCAI